ncbi:hypothetical protein HYH03_009351 [Edaphochlamys debaryana]|uniref:Uncharacterized protein n=1 Tax=Edaphochlamys debaryana TaxID=47281 RepID=A0A835XYR2_9CHLO|nr:hypothetical protein HYH03_009351 [Edaphochlamys debaryana]|eukprot:KAG2492405.1 hypothetical protein HYH03_009351 [Edaphochlamys debaryana]
MGDRQDRGAGPSLDAVLRALDLRGADLLAANLPKEDLAEASKLPEEARRRIEALTVRTDSEFYAYRRGFKAVKPSIPAPIFTTLAALLPNLRDLDLTGLSSNALPKTPVDRSYLYSALSALPLESLGLPSAHVAQGIECLAGSLSDLTLGSPHGAGTGDDGLPGRAVASIRQLHRLDRLSVVSVHLANPDPDASSSGSDDEEDEAVEEPPCAEQGGLAGLLNALPTALKKLVWIGEINDDYDSEVKATFSIKAGAVKDVSLDLTPCFPDNLSQLAADVLLPSAALRRKAEILVLPEMYLTCTSAGAWESVEELKPLMARFKQVYIGELNVSMPRPSRACPKPATEDEALRRAADHARSLGRTIAAVSKPAGCIGRLQLDGFPRREASLSVTYDGCAEGDKAAPLGLGPEAPPAALPSRFGVLQRALKRLGAGGQGGEQLVDSRVLLLLGPAAEQVAELGRGALEEWALRVERRAEAAALAGGPGAGAGPEEGGSGVLLSGVQALPQADAVLVECGEAEGALEAVEAALAGAAMQVLRCRLPEEMVEEGAEWCDALAWALRQVVPEAWDAAARAEPLHYRLQWLLEVRVMLSSLPPYLAMA